MTTSANQNPSPLLSLHEVFPEDQKEFLVKITKVYTSIAAATNSRTVGTYDLQQLQNGQSWFNTADPKNLISGFRRVYEVGATAPGATTPITHGIAVTGNTLFTHIYGTCETAAPRYFPIPYVDPTDVTKSVSVYLNNNTIFVVNGTAAPAITYGIIVLEYVLG